MKYTTISVVAVVAMFLASCGGGETKQDANVPDATAKEEVKEEAYDPMTDKGIGPISSLTLGEVDQAMADAGKEKFETLCAACHKLDKRFVGPPMAGVTERRTPEWIMNMILNPEEMVQKNEAARNLLMEYSAPMANQNLTEEEARSVLEYFRTIDQ